MKKRNGLLIIILILISISCFSQSKEICLPEEVVDKIIANRIDQKNLEYKISIKDSIIHVYEHNDSVSTVEIRKLKLNNTDYILVISNLEKLGLIDKAEITDLKSEAKRKKIKNIIIDTVQYGFIAVLTWIAIKNSID